jgi:hypothetical protein
MSNSTLLWIEKRGKTVILFLEALILTFRSRRGFLQLLSFFRLIAVLGIGISLGISYPYPSMQAWYLIVIVSYLVYSALAIIFFSRQKTIPDTYGFYHALILIDTIAISFFIALNQNVRSELYLFYLIPLVTSAHFLPRRQAIIETLSITFIYGLSLLYIQTLSPQKTAEIPSLIAAWVWVSRSTFLLAGTWLYRIQRSLPPAKETRILSPTQARSILEDLLVDLKKTVDYTTISVQLLYLNRLHIVACKGFSEPEEVYRIEFPADDHRFPNYQVIESKRPKIDNPKKYDSFHNPMYHCTHVRSWLGVPLISPSTGELFGMITIDSDEEDAYESSDARIASWFAKKASTFLIESALGPAALTLSTKRESLHKIIKDWANTIPDSVRQWQDDLKAANELVKVCKNIFMVEDCSISFLRSKHSGKKEDPLKVLHLVASTAIPESDFTKHESLATGKRGDGLTGYSVRNNRTINFGFSDIEKSPYRGSYLGHLVHFPSKRSKQIMISPLNNSDGEPIGAIKVENKIGWPSEIRFPYVEQNLFEAFAHLSGLIIEEIRQMNYIDRHISNVHHLRAILSEAVIKPLSSVSKEVSEVEGHTKDSNDKISNIQKAVSHIASSLDYTLFNPQNDLILENEGVMPALIEFVNSLQDGFPNLRDTCECILFESTQTRDNLPLKVRVAFYNIGREALLNIIKHSGIASTAGCAATISFELKNSTYHIRIEDNGVGFDLDQTHDRLECYGLRDMHRQVHSISDLDITKEADLEIMSHPSQGTLVSAWWTPSASWRFTYGGSN